MENYMVLNRLGKGSQGSVHLVKHRDDAKKYVLKKIECKDEGEANKAFSEAMLLRSLTHPYICGYKEFFIKWDKDDCALYFCIVMTYYKNGDLGTILRMRRDKKETTDEDLIQKWFGQILSALMFVHKQGLLHRDLKPSNIFLNEDMNAIVGDFGVATVMKDAHSNSRMPVGTLNYLAPESSTLSIYSDRSDIWSLGCVLFELMTSAMFDSKDAPNKLAVLKDADSTLLDEICVSLKEQYSASLLAVLKRTLNVNSDERPTATELLTDPYVKSCVDKVNPTLIAQRKRQASATVRSKEIPTEDGISAVMDHLRLVMLSEPKVLETFEYLVDLCREGTADIDAKSKLLIASAMRDNLLQKDIQLTGCNIFNYLVLTANPDDILFSSDIINIIPASMKAHASCPDLQQAAIGLLTALSASDEASKLIGSLGGISDILVAIHQYIDDADICATCLSALWSLSVNETNARRLTDEKGLAIVCDVLQKHSDNVDIAETAAAALLSLSLEDKNLDYVEELDIASLLMGLIHQHSNHAKVVKNACMALSSYVEPDEITAYSVMTYRLSPKHDIEGIPLIIKAYEIHKDNAAVVEAVCTLLMELAAYDEIKAEMVYLQLGYSLFTEVQKRFRENKEIMMPCETALKRLHPTLNKDNAYKY